MKPNFKKKLTMALAIFIALIMLLGTGVTVLFGILGK